MNVHSLPQALSTSRDKLCIARPPGLHVAIENLIEAYLYHKLERLQQ